VASSIVSVADQAVTLPVGLHADRLKRKIPGALLLTVAICGLHFNGRSLDLLDLTVNSLLRNSPLAGWR
jgi:NO-binding membrane sensor protein with MHYT domain